MKIKRRYEDKEKSSLKTATRGAAAAAHADLAPDTHTTRDLHNTRVCVRVCDLSEAQKRPACEYQSEVINSS